MHEKQKFMERVIVGLVASAIAIEVLTSDLPRVMPYVVVLAVIFMVVRVVFYHTNKW
jgi:hypothetical protein